MAIFTIDLIPPQPNLNGNTEKSLLDQLRVVMHNLDHLAESMRASSDCWHGRNFLPQGSPEARIMRELAQDAWSLRFDVVNTMKEEILAVALQIQGGVSPKLPEPPATILVDPTDLSGWVEVDGGYKTVEEWEKDASPAEIEFVDESKFAEFVDESTFVEIDEAVSSIVSKLSDRDD